MIHVITGAPCSGKTTYVNENAQDGDVIIDYDAIARAIGADGHRPDGEIAQAAFAARRALIEWALENSDSEVWVIHTSPTEKQVDEYESVGAEFVNMDTPMDECLARCESDNRPDGTEQSIRDYFDNERSSKGANLMNTKEFNLEIKAAGEDAPSITAYASTFDREPDSYGDVVAKGAFAKTLEEWASSGLSIPLLFGHRTDDPMMNLGKVVSAVEDEKGLLIEAEFDMDNPNAVKARRDVLAGTLGKMSFAFDVVSAGPVTLDNGVKANELREMKLFEVSLVPIPANQHAVVVDAKDAPAEEKAGRRNSAKDEGTLGHIADLASEIITEVDSLTAVDDMPQQSEEQTEEVERSEEQTEAKSMDEEQTEAKGRETDEERAEDGEGEEETTTVEETTDETKEKSMSNAIIESIGTETVETAPKSIGEFAAKSFAGIDAKQQFAKSVEYKTDPTTISGVPQLIDYDKNPVNVMKAPTIADLFGRETISGNALTYYVMADKNGGAGTTAEGGKKNQVDFGYTPKTVALTKLTGFIVETDEILNDSPWLATACQDRLLNKLALAEEAQLISGNGTAPNMTGVLNTSGIGSVTYASTLSADDVFKAIMKVKEDSNLDADAIVINPTDYQALRLAKDSNDQYYGGGYFYGEYGQGNGAMVPSLWGLKTVISTAVSAGTVLVGAFKQAASIVSKDGLTVEATNTNGEDFVYNRVTIRAEKREALAVRIPAGFVKVSKA